MANCFTTLEKLKKNYQFLGDMELEFREKRRGLDFKRLVKSTGFSVDDGLGVYREFHPVNSRLWLFFGSDDEMSIDEAGGIVSAAVDYYPGDGPFRTHMYEVFMASSGRDNFFRFIEEEAKSGGFAKILTDNTQMKFKI